jgi:leucyl aminopeptidase
MIELMKFDMGGSGATLGAARILADTKPEGVEVRNAAIPWPHSMQL